MITANEARIVYEEAMQPEAVLARMLAAQAEELERQREREEYEERQRQMIEGKRVFFETFFAPIGEKIAEAAAKGEREISGTIGMRRSLNDDVNIRKFNAEWSNVCHMNHWYDFMCYSDRWYNLIKEMGEYFNSLGYQVVFYSTDFPGYNDFHFFDIKW